MSTQTQRYAEPSARFSLAKLSQQLPRLWMLMRREMWENRVSFIWAPLTLSAGIIVLSFMTMFMAHKIDSEFVTTVDLLQKFATEIDPVEKQQFVGGGLLVIQVLFGVVLFIVTVFYLLGALYDDRKDRSILFWKSLPISDTMTIVSKLASATILLPGLYLLTTMATQIILLIIASGYGLLADINPWVHFWQPAQLFTNWSIYILGALVQALWLLPLWTWFLFCSSFAPRLPLLFAVITPLVVAWIQKYMALIQTFNYKSTTILYYIAQRITNAVLPLNVQAKVGDESFVVGFGESEDARQLFDHALSLQYLGERMLDPSLWTGIVIALAFAIATIYFRRRATDQ